jgi:UDP-N-acetyl-D-mannosaminuronic acid dehydrogenase
MVNVIGLGYIGLPTALMFAAHGVKVTGTDYNRDRVLQLNHGEIPFEEKGVEELFSEAVKQGIRFSQEYIKTDTYIIAVPTPYDSRSKKIDPSFVVSAVNSVLEVCPQDAVMVIESTVSPGTIDRYIRPLVENHMKRVHLVHAPERIIPGNMVYELKHNARTVGADSEDIAQKVRVLYSAFCEGDIVLTDIRTAEMTKVVENTFRDINIAYANELAKICRSDKMDVYEIIRIANKHPRVNILQPGPGVGGHCISVDPWFLVGDYPGLANIILAARKINDSMPEFVLERVSEIMEEHHLTDLCRVGIYGLTYKENVDDTRESPTLQLLECMHRHLARGVKVYDPWVKRDLVENQTHSLDEFLKNLDLVVIMVAHDEIRQNMDKLKGKLVLDTRKICELEGTFRL